MRNHHRHMEQHVPDAIAWYQLAFLCFPGVVILLHPFVAIMLLARHYYPESANIFEALMLLRNRTAANNSNGSDRAAANNSNGRDRAAANNSNGRESDRRKKTARRKKRAPRYKK